MSNRINKVFVYSFAQFVNVLVAFLLSPYLSRALEKTEYAIYNQVLYVGGFFTIIFSIGLFNVINYFFSKNDNQQDRITIQSLILILGIGATVIFFLVTLFFPGQLFYQLLQLYSFSFVFSFAANYLNAVLIINNNTKYVALCTVLITVLSSTGLLLAIQKFHSIKLAFFIVGIIMPLFNFVLLYGRAKKYIYLKLSFTKTSIKNIVKVSGPLYITNVLGASYTYVAAFFVNFFGGSIAFANYKNGAVELPFISSIAFSVSAVLMPDLAKMFNENKLQQIYLLKKKMINQVIFIIYPVILYFLVFHYEFITAYFSLKYKESAIIFAIYTCTCFIRINDYKDVLVASGNTKYILRSNVYYSICNIILVIVLGYFYKGVGIAVASFISVFYLAFTLLSYDAAILSVKFKDFFETDKIVKLSLLCLVFLIPFREVLNYYKTGSVNSILISSVVYFPVAYFVLYALNFFEKNIIKSIVSKIPVLKKLVHD